MSQSCCCGQTIEEEKENILDKITDFLSSLTMTIVGVLFLIASLVLRLTDTHVLIDPAWGTVAISGIPILYNALWMMIYNKGVHKISTALLISIAMIAAIYIGELFAAGQVAFIMAIGGILEEKTVERARKGIGRLINLMPEQGRIIIDGKDEMIPVENIRKNDILRVLPGETIPVDGEIISGDTTVDQSIVTGESLPIDKTVGDNVFCGTINCFGSVDIKATNIGVDSSLQKLIRLVQDADENKAPTQLIVDKWAVWLVPLAFAIAIATYFIFGDIIRAVTVAIVFCPCALVLATPTSIIAAIGQAAKHGVIIKSGDALERMGKIGVIAFDKTGTLTHGNLEVSDIVSFDESKTGSDVLFIAASAESHSEHPLGKAITSYAKEQVINVQLIEDFFMQPGKGVGASLDGKKVLCGSAVFMHENGIALSSTTDTALQQFRKQGKAAILIAYGYECIGVIALSDVLRPTAKSMVEELKKEHTSSVLLTGDNKQTAEYFAQQIGIDSIYAELLPVQKVEQILALQNEGKNVCMIGDGVNDAPALKTANVGVAMGTIGSDIAVEAADIALMGDDIEKIPYLKRLSNATTKIIKVNIIISIVFNIAAVTLSMLGLLNPITGALAHNIGSVAVILNAALLYDRNYMKKSKAEVAALPHPVG